jgi:hypothetical protein
MRPRRLLPSPLHTRPRRPYIIFRTRASIPFLFFHRWFSYKFPRRAQLSHKVSGLMESFCALEVFGFFDNPISDVRWTERKKKRFCIVYARGERDLYIGNSTTRTTIYSLYTRQPQRRLNSSFFFLSRHIYLFVYLFFVVHDIREISSHK